MPENIFLSPSLLANPQTFTWIKADILSERTKAAANERAAWNESLRKTAGHLKFTQSEYRSNFRVPTTIAPDPTRLILRDSASPFSGNTCCLPLYKSSGSRPYPTLATSEGDAMLPQDVKYDNAGIRSSRTKSRSRLGKSKCRDIDEGGRMVCIQQQAPSINPSKSA